MYDKQQAERLRRAMNDLSRAEETLAIAADVAREQGNHGAASAFEGMRRSADALYERVRYGVLLLGKGSADVHQ